MRREFILIYAKEQLQLTQIYSNIKDHTNEYPNIFVSKKWYERIYEYIRIQKKHTNEYTNIFISKKWYEYDTNEYSYRKILEYIRISEYSPHPVTELLISTYFVQEPWCTSRCTCTMLNKNSPINRKFDVARAVVLMMQDLLSTDSCDF